MNGSASRPRSAALKLGARRHYRDVPGFDVVQNARVLLDPDLDPSSKDGPRRNYKPFDGVAVECRSLTIDTKPPAAISDFDLGPSRRLKKRGGRNVPERLKCPPISGGDEFASDGHQAPSWLLPAYKRMSKSLAFPRVPHALRSGHPLNGLHLTRFVGRAPRARSRCSSKVQSHGSSFSIDGQRQWNGA